MTIAAGRARLQAHRHPAQRGNCRDLRHNGIIDSFGV